MKAGDEMGICILIVNPSSGGEKATGYLELMRTWLSEMFEKVTVKETEKQGDAEQFAQEAATLGHEAVFCMAAMALSTKPSMAWRLPEKACLSGSFRWAPSTILQEQSVSRWTLSRPSACWVMRPWSIWT